jgi:riboflavin synthase alpha subunit
VWLSRSRHREIIEIDNVSKEDAPQYLKLRKINVEHATQTYNPIGGHIIHIKVGCR